VAAIPTLDDPLVSDAPVQTDQLRPARRGGRPVAVVERDGDRRRPLKLD